MEVEVEVELERAKDRREMEESVVELVINKMVPFILCHLKY